MKTETNIALLKKDIAYMKEGIDHIRGSVDCMVKNDGDYQDVVKKVNTLWDDRNKVVGWLMGAGIIGGAVPVVFQSLIKAVSAHF